jgi:hypothetical protein
VAAQVLIFPNVAICWYIAALKNQFIATSAANEFIIAIYPAFER